MIDTDAYKKITETLKPLQTLLVAVSKLKPVSDIQEMYALGQRDFGENYIQELAEKQALLPADIRWHAIGHLQTNKVKYIASFVQLIQSVDSEKLLKEIDKQAAKNNRKINCLLQVHIAEEETKFGFNEAELAELNFSAYPNVVFCGLMGMATFTDDKEKVKKEFLYLKNIFDKMKEKFSKDMPILSMGMSDDYLLAAACGSNMVRIGSLLFGKR